MEAYFFSCIIELFCVHSTAVQLLYTDVINNDRRLIEGNVASERYCMNI